MSAGAEQTVAIPTETSAPDEVATATPIVIVVTATPEPSPIVIVVTPTPEPAVTAEPTSEVVSTATPEGQ